MTAGSGEYSKAKRYIDGPLPGGGSEPHVIGFDDNTNYVVKFKNNPQGLQVLVNEFVIGEFIQLVGFSGIEGGIVCVPQEFIDSENQLRIQNTQQKFIGGLQFGLRYIKGITNFSVGHIDKIENRHEFPQIILIDSLFYNSDRKAEHILLERIPNETYKFYMVDHGHCFDGSSWNNAKLQSLLVNLKLLDLIGLRPHIKEPEAFEPFLAKVEAVTEDEIVEIVDNIPGEWLGNLTNSDKHGLIEFIKEAKNRLRDLITRSL